MKTWTYMSQSLKCLIFYRVGWKETNKKKAVWFLDLNPGGLKVCIGMQEWIKLLYFSFPLVSQARACFLPKLSPIPLGCASRRCEQLWERGGEGSPGHCPLQLSQLGLRWTRVNTPRSSRTSRLSQPLSWSRLIAAGDPVINYTSPRTKGTACQDVCWDKVVLFFCSVSFFILLRNPENNTV